MAQKQLPKNGNSNWDIDLSEWLGQIGPSSKGGLNYNTSNPSTTGWGADEEGYTFTNTSESKMKRWNGTAWEDLLTGSNIEYPTGGIMQFGGSIAPLGWLICRGQEVSRLAYADLFTIISTTYGAGDGSTTFNLPNLQEKIVIGVDGSYTLGSTGGSSSFDFSHPHSLTHDHSIAMGGAHYHWYSCPTGSSNSCAAAHGGIPRCNLCAHGHTVSGYTDGAASTGGHSHGWAMVDTAGTTGSGGSSTQSNISPYLAVNYIIKI